MNLSSYTIVEVLSTSSTLFITYHIENKEAKTGFSVYLEKVLPHLYINGNDDSLFQGYEEVLETLELLFPQNGFFSLYRPSIQVRVEIWDGFSVE